MGTRYSYGIVTERRLMAELASNGFAVTRASGSKGDWDLVAVRGDVLWLVSVKRCPTWKRAAAVYRAEHRRVAALEVPATPRIKKILAIWSDELNPETPGRGGAWYCIEEVKGEPCAPPAASKPRAKPKTKPASPGASA